MRLREFRGDSEERTDVFADSRIDTDVESTLAGHIEGRAGDIFRFRLAAVECHAALARDDFHALRCTCAKVIAAWVDEPEGLLGAIGHDERVTDHLAVEIDIRLGVGGDVGELGWKGVCHGEGRNAWRC